jgi:hypothetical protein
MDDGHTGRKCSDRKGVSDSNGVLRWQMFTNQPGAWPQGSKCRIGNEARRRTEQANSPFSSLQSRRPQR